MKFRDDGGDPMHMVTETNTMSREAAESAFRLLAAIARRKKKTKQDKPA
jgi:hypothetical protein